MDKQYFLPADVDELCRTLRDAGFAAHPVGGAVRDLILNRIPGDWDVATSALPHQTATLFGGRARLTGATHGTVTVSTGIRDIEVTTFRKEGPYSDRRRPDWVEFVDDIHTDLARRDFTMNAIALGSDDVLIDPFGGQNDLLGRTIRTVGDPNIRFFEDGLRLFRAVRFAAQLDFDLGEAELSALTAHPEWGTPISAERIRIEVEKALCAAAPQKLEVLFSSRLMARFIENRSTPSLTPLAALPPLPTNRWAGLCRALLTCGAISDPEVFLRSFNMDKRTLRGTLSLLTK